MTSTVIPAPSPTWSATRYGYVNVPNCHWLSRLELCACVRGLRMHTKLITVANETAATSCMSV